MRYIIPIVSLSILAATIDARAEDIRDIVSPDKGWSVVIASEGCHAGDRIPWRLAWTNEDSKAVRVPVDLLAQARPDVRRELAKPGPDEVSVALSVPTSQKPQAIDWVVVEPGQSLQQLGTLGDWLADCRPGCPAGAYTVTFGNLPAVQFLLQPPPTPATIPVTQGPGVDVTFTRVGPKKPTRTAMMRLRIVNRLSASIWVPKDAGPLSWNGRQLEMSGEETGWGSTTCCANAPWGPEDAVLLKPGAAWSVDLPVSIDGRPRHAWAKVAFFVHGTFVAPAGIASPFFLHGRIDSPEASVF